MKTCFKCHRTLPASEFYVHSSMRDGRLNKCKECTRADANAYYIANIESCRDYERRRSADPDRKQKVAEYQRRQRSKHPEKYLARQKVKRAVKAGLMKRPAACDSCGDSAPLQAHHHDYSKPLDVQWLCFRCHRTHGHNQMVA